VAIFSRSIYVRKWPQRPQKFVAVIRCDWGFHPLLCSPRRLQDKSTTMSINLPLPNDPGLHPTPSHSATSLDPPSTPSSAAHDSIRPKAERRVSLGVLESAKFRFSHDVSVLVSSSLSPFFPLLYLTRGGRTLFFPVCPSRQVT
jgi:hypothetical protein